MSSSALAQLFDLGQTELDLIHQQHDRLDALILFRLLQTLDRILQRRWLNCGEQGEFLAAWFLQHWLVESENGDDLLHIVLCLIVAVCEGSGDKA
jgi:hypothetical protein